MVPGHPPCALCSLISRRSDPETNRFGKISFTLKLVFPESFLAVQLSRCAAVRGARDGNSVRRARATPYRQTLKTIQSDPRLRIFAIILFERSLTFRFASLKLFNDTDFRPQSTSVSASTFRLQLSP